MGGDWLCRYCRSYNSSAYDVCIKCGPRGGTRPAAVTLGVRGEPPKAQADRSFKESDGKTEVRRLQDRVATDAELTARYRRLTRERSRSRERTGAGGSWDVPASQDPAEAAEEKEKEKPKKETPQIRPRNDGKSVADLIGVVRPVRNPSERRLCEHFLKNDCLWGDQCRFSHDPEELRAGAPATTEMDFSAASTDAGRAERIVVIPRTQLRFIMTERTRQLLSEASGVSEITWDTTFSRVIVYGTPVQVESGEQLLKRVTTHCNWGCSEAKVHGLLSLRPCKAARLRLSPMVPSLKQMDVTLTNASPLFTMGADPSNDLVLKGQLISRGHVVLEFNPEKGCLYVIDRSTNGTFLNGVRLPSKSSGKVVLWHGDELRFPEPNSSVNANEFGYMVNLEMS